MIDTPWRRLDPRMLVVGPLKNLLQLLPFLVVVVLTGRSGDLAQVWMAVGGADGVEVDLGGAVHAGRPARRTDPHDAQTEDPVQRRRREVDSADAVAGHRAALAA